MRWIASRKPSFFVHVNALRRLFRGKVLSLLTEAHAEGRLQFFGKLAALADKKTFKRFLAPLRRIKWVVYCKDPLAGPEAVLRYLSRYTHRVAISNRRLASVDVDDSKRRKTGCDVACPSGPWSSGQSWLRSLKAQSSGL
jgi:hypothetical protein